MRVLLWAALVTIATWAYGDSPNLLANPGFEDGLSAWSRHYRATRDWVLDTEIAHSGARSMRCELADPAERTGFTQRLQLNQKSAAPLKVSVWYRTDKVTGPPHRSFAIVLAVEYTTDTRPGQTDDAFIFPLQTGTHEWMQLREIVVPQAPIAWLHFHCEMKNRTGSAWFDDLSLTVLSEAPLVGPPTELRPWRQEEPPEPFTRAMRTLEPEAMLLYVRQMRTQDYHVDPLRPFVNYEEKASGEAGALSDALISEPVTWVSTLVREPLQPPYAHVGFRRRWDELSLLIEAQGRTGQQVEMWLALPVGLYAARVQFHGWEPDFDAVEVGALEGRVVVRAVPETASGRDAIEFDLVQAQRELPPLEVVRHPGAVSVGTSDGLELLLADGRAVGLVLDGTMMYSPVIGEEGLQGDGGFYVGDLMVGSFRPIVGGMEAKDAEVRQGVELRDLGLRFEASYTPMGDRILVEGEIRDLTGEDRAIDLVFKLPARCDGWTWSNALYDRCTIELDGRYETRYPMAAVSDGRYGLAMALPPDRPANAIFGYNPRSALFHLRFKCGLSAAMSDELRSCHPFAFLIYRCDGAWGWRDAIERYQAMFPDYFRPRCPVHGKWLFQARPNRVPNPQQFAYDEGSYDFDLDDRFGVGSFPYLIPGQREIKHLQSLPNNYEEAMAAFAAFEPEDANEIRTQRGWGRNIKEIIDNCVATRPDGRRYLSIRNTPWGGPSVTFYLNMDPDLFADRGLPVVGAHELGHVKAMMAENPSLDGIYLDSWSSWGAMVDNCRRDHFPYAAYPLTYDEATGTLCLRGQWSALEFLGTLNDLLHPTGRYVLANLGARLHTFSAMWLDIVGIEGGTRPGRAQVEEFRPVVGQKQLCVLEHLQFLGGDDGIITREEYDAYAKRCLLWGAIPSVTWFDGYAQLYEANRDLFDLYYALAVRLSKAGWHAVTGARSDRPEVRLERFGPEADGTVLITVLNTADTALRATVRIDPALLNLSDDVRATRLIGEGTLTGNEVSLELPASALEVLELRPR